MTTITKRHGLARLEVSTQPEFLAGVGKVRGSEWRMEKGMGRMGRKRQLSVKYWVICQLPVKWLLLLTEDLKPLQCFEGMYTGYTMSRLKNYYIMRTFRE